MYSIAKEPINLLLLKKQTQQDTHFPFGSTIFELFRKIDNFYRSFSESKYSF